MMMRPVSLSCFISPFELDLGDIEKTKTYPLATPKCWVLTSFLTWFAVAVRRALFLSIRS